MMVCKLLAGMVVTFSGDGNLKGDGSGDSSGV